MPPLIVAISEFLFLSTALSATASLIVAEIIVGALVIGGTVVLGEISKMFQKQPSGSSLSHQLASRSVTSRQAVAPWRVFYGAVRSGGIITALTTNCHRK